VWNHKIHLYENCDDNCGSAQYVYLLWDAQFNQSLYIAYTFWNLLSPDRQIFCSRALPTTEPAKTGNSCMISNMNELEGNKVSPLTIPRTIHPAWKLFDISSYLVVVRVQLLHLTSNSLMSSDTTFSGTPRVTYSVNPVRSFDLKLVSSGCMGRRKSIGSSPDHLVEDHLLT